MMMTKRIVVLAFASGALLALPGTASAAPNFSVMQLNLLCPDFDGPLGPGNDAVLLDTAKRVYQGKPIAVNNKNPEMSACKRFVHNGKGGWFAARVTWSSDKNPSLYVENTAAWAGSQGDEAHDITLFLDGNGSANDFNKYYVDPKTNILNDPGLTITIEVQAKGKCEKEKVEKHCVDHHKDRGKCDHDNGKYGICGHKRGDNKCGHDDDDDGLCIHEKGDGSDCVHKRGDGKCGHGRVYGRDDDDDGKCHHERDDGGQCVHEKGDGKCGCDKGDKKHGGGECANQWLMVNQQKLKPVPWALWSLHSGDSADLYAEINRLDTRINNINNNNNLKQYVDDQIADLHNHVHQEISAEATLREQSDIKVLNSANSYTDIQLQSEATTRSQQDAILQKQIDGKVNSVSGAFPITSTGGTDPIVGLAPCKDGEAYVWTNGKWACAPIAQQPGKDVYNRTILECGQTDLLTTQTGCTFPLPRCVFKADIPLSCPQAPAKCVFNQTDTSQECVAQHIECEFWGCFPVCDKWEPTFCGDCQCEFPRLGALMK